MLRFWPVVAVLAGACGGSSLEVDQQRSGNRYEIALDFFAKGELEAAELEAQRALGHDPHNELAHNLLGLIDLRRAAQHKRLLEIDDCLTGVDAEGLGQELDQLLLRARKHFEDALAANVEYGEAQHNLATVDMLLGDYESAATLYGDALGNAARLDSPPLTRANLGWAYFHIEDHPRAAAELRKAISFHPGMCLAHYRLGRVYFARQEWENALREFEDVVAQAKQCPIQEAHLFLARTYLESGLGASVPKVVEACVALAPRSCVAAQCRALTP